MSNICDDCKKMVYSKAPGMQCNGPCKLWFHRKCKNVNKDAFNLFAMQEIEWKCNTCKKNTRSSFVGAPDGMDSVHGTTEDVVNKEQTRSLTEMLLDLKNEVAGLKLVNVDLLNSVSEISAKIDAFQLEVLSLKEENVTLKKAVKTLEDKVKKNGLALEDKIKKLENELNVQEQYSKNYNVELAGVPQAPKENAVTTENIAIAIFKHIGVSIVSEDIEQARRLYVGKHSKTPPKILIRFHKKDRRDSILDMKKNIRGRITASDIGISGPNSQIFINQHLTRKNYLLYKEAKKLQKETKIKYVWMTNNATILTRRDDGDPIIPASKLVSSLISPTPSEEVPSNME